MALSSNSREDYENRSDNRGLQPYYLENGDISSAKDRSGKEGERHWKRDTAILLEVEQDNLEFDVEVYIGGNFAIDWDNWDQQGEPPRKQPLSWGSNFKVDELAARAGLEPLFDQDRQDNVIREEVLHGLTGLHVVYLRYAYGYKDESEGKIGYTRYDRVRFPHNFVDEAETYLENQDEPTTKENVRNQAIDLARMSLEDQFLDDVHDGYIDDFDREVVEHELAKRDGGDGEADASDGMSREQRAGQPVGGDGQASDDFDEKSYAGHDDEDTFEPDDELPF